MKLNIKTLNFEKTGGLIPAIIQDDKTMEVLMLGFMDAAALNKTLKTKKVTFYSRTKKRLWTKGETSGNFLNVLSVASDCDNDTLLVRVNPAGPVCHKGTQSCFAGAEKNRLGWLSALEDVIEKRKKTSPEKSYTAKLFKQGTARIAQKVGEEGLETALAAVRPEVKTEEFSGEAADLIFHLLVLLNAKKLTLSDVCQTLEERHK